MSEAEQQPTLETWAIVELMGHVKLAGKVTEEQHFGATLMRLDVPECNGVAAYTQFIGGASIYRVTPCSEEVARGVVAFQRPAPVQAYEMPRLRAPVGRDDDPGEQF